MLGAARRYTARPDQLLDNRRGGDGHGPYSSCIRGVAVGRQQLTLGVVAPASAQTCSKAPASYYDNTGRADALSGGVRMIPISTPKGTFRVWTQRIGNNPRIKVLLLVGGPAMPHNYLEAFNSWFPCAGIEFYY